LADICFALDYRPALRLELQKNTVERREANRKTVPAKAGKGGQTALSSAHAEPAQVGGQAKSLS
jgi:hypothetical protein